MSKELFRIVLGPNNSLQTPLLVDELKNMATNGLFGSRKIKFEVITIQKIVSLHMPASEFLAWCRNATYLLFAGHPLQNDYGPLWDHDRFCSDLRDLCASKGKRAFPPAQAVGGAFTQNKWEIYEALADMMLPAFQIKRPNGPDRTVTHFDENVMSELYEYVKIRSYLY